MALSPPPPYYAPYPYSAVPAPRPRQDVGTVLLVILVVAASIVIVVAVLFGPFLRSGFGPARTEWAFQDTGVNAFANQGFRGEGIVICVVDSGIDLSHPDLGGLHLRAWKDFVFDRPQPYDDDGHGTAMAGIIFANGTLRGVAPGATLIVAKAITGSGQGTTSDVADAIDFCRDPDQDGDSADGADIISLSLGGDKKPVLGSETTQAVNRAALVGILVVASAGNDGEADNGDVESPASEPLAIAVGAIGEGLRIAPFSSIGDNDGVSPSTVDDRKPPNQKPELSAPGVEINSLAPQGRFAAVSGTSPAAAFAAGAFALLLQKHPAYRHSGSSSTVVAFKQAIREGALKAEGQALPHDDHYGYGILNLATISSRL